MENLLPTLIETAKNVVTNSLPPGTISEEDNHKMDEFVNSATQNLFSGLSNNSNGSGGGDPFSSLLGSMLGGGNNNGGSSGSGGGNGLNMNNLMSMLGGGMQQKNNDDIHEFVDVSLEDYFNRKDFNIKFLAKVFDESTCSIKKKKKKITVQLPLGANEKYTYVVENLGHFNYQTKTCGNLHVHFRLQKNHWNEIYTRSGQDLIVHYPIESFQNDAFFFERLLPHPCGKLLKIVVDPNLLQNEPLGIDHNEQIRIQGFGYPAFENKPVGSLLIRIDFKPSNYKYINGDFIFQGESKKNLIDLKDEFKNYDTLNVKIRNLLNPISTTTNNNSINTNTKIIHIEEENDEDSSVSEEIEEFQEVEEIENTLNTIEEVD